MPNLQNHCGLDAYKLYFLSRCMPQKEFTMIFELIVYIILASIFCDARRYDNYTLFRGIPVEDSHLEFLHNLSSVYDVNFWRMPGSLRMPVDFLMGPDFRESFLKEADKKGVYLTTIISDIQSAFDKQTVKSYTRKRMDTFDWHDFYRTKDIYDWLNDIAKAFPNEVNVFSIGKTHEDRDILAVKVALKGSLLRSKVIIEGGIHAREWISPAFVTYMLHRIIYSSISADRNLRNIALTYEWFFVPILNPDGYEYTMNTDRNWRKNRHGTGVDLNRNFGYGFGSEGVSFNKHADVYCGSKAFSEKESSAMGRFIKSQSDNLEFYISFHAYGQYMILPYAHSSKHVENYDEMKQMALRAAEKIKSYYNTKYSVGTAYDTVGYKVSGASTCWAKKSFHVPYCLTMELRDEGSYGFALPPKDIIPTCEETLGGIVELLTPKSKEFLSIKHEYTIDTDAGQARMYLDKIVILFIAMFFITV